MSTETPATKLAELSKAGMSTRATASALGMSKDTVHRDRIVSSETMPDAVKCSDGRSYPARREPKAGLPVPPDRPWDAEHIAALVAQAPPLSDAVWQRISALFASGGGQR